MAIETPPAPPSQSVEIEKGCGIVGAIAIILGVSWSTYSCAQAPEKSPEQIQREIAQADADRAAGYHCLSTWDGSHSGLVEQLTAGLRNPNSFEHDETLLSPVDANGDHQIIMRYRAENGFGGTTIGYVQGTMSNANCRVTITGSN